MNTIKVYFVCIVIFCVPWQVVTQGKECFHELYSKPGKCINLKFCPTAIKDLKKRQFPQKCGFDGLVPIVCCLDDNYVDTTKTIPIGQRSIQKCKEYGEMVKNFKSSCNIPLPTPMISHDNGLHVVPGEFPHMVAFVYVSQNGSIEYFCAGTLISEKYVLTAAYCTNLSGYNGPISVRIGDVSLKSKDGDIYSKTVDILKIIIHPGYKPPNVYDDLALIELKTRVNFTDHIYPACLNTKDDDHGSTFALSWGESRGMTDKLQMKIKLDIYPHKKCVTYFELYDHILENGVSNRTQLCAGVPNTSKYLCKVTNDDSGGPLITMSDVFCMYNLIGVTSIGDACTLEKRPRLYSRVTNYIEWIENNVWP